MADLLPTLNHSNTTPTIAARETVDFIVYKPTLKPETKKYASVVLPMNAPAESDGTFTNMEKRIQRIQRILAPKGECKDAWRIFQEIMLRSGPSRPFFNAKEIMEAISREAPGYTAKIYDE